MTNIDLAVLLDRLLRRIHLRLSEKAKRFDTEKVGPGGAMILLTIDDAQELSMQALTQRLVRDKSQMTRAVGPLVRKGFVQRTQDPQDARVTKLTLTAKGAAMVATHQTALAETLDEVLAHMPQAKREALRALISEALASDHSDPSTLDQTAED